MVLDECEKMTDGNLYAFFSSIVTLCYGTLVLKEFSHVYVLASYVSTFSSSLRFCFFQISCHKENKV